MLNKIESSDLIGKGVLGQEDTPGLSVESMQLAVEGIPREVIIPKFNALVDALSAATDGDSGADNIKATAITNVTGTTVQSLLEGLKAYIDAAAFDGGLVTSVFGRIGAVLPQAGDYTADMVGARPDDWMPTLSEVGGNRSNLLDNGDFQNPINQRGFTEEATSSKYTLDRWKTEFSEPGVGSVLYDGTNKCLIIRRTGTGKTLLVRQSFELPLPENISVTVTIKLQDGSVYATTLIPTNTSQTRDLDTSKSLRVYISRQDFAIVNYSATIANADIAIQWVKMEYGTSSTPFYPEINPEDELRRCQLFYENSWYPLAKSNEQEMFAHIFSSTQADVRVEFKTTKRVLPSMAFYPRGSATDWQVYNGGYFNVGDKASTGRGTCNAGTIRLAKGAGDTSTWTPGNTIRAHGHWEAIADL